MIGAGSNPMEKFEETHYKKYYSAIESSAREEAEMIRKVDEYIAEKVRQGRKYEELRAEYLKKYYDFLERSPVQPLDKNQRHKPLSTEQKFVLIKRLIYMSEILPEEKKRAAALSKAA